MFINGKHACIYIALLKVFRLLGVLYNTLTLSHSPIHTRSHRFTADDTQGADHGRYVKTGADMLISRDTALHTQSKICLTQFGDAARGYLQPEDPGIKNTTLR